MTKTLLTLDAVRARLAAAWPVRPQVAQRGPRDTEGSSPR
jgi:hypothetical protein